VKVWFEQCVFDRNAAMYAGRLLREMLEEIRSLERENARLRAEHQRLMNNLSRAA
jgi:hypothetical protein